MGQGWLRYGQDATGSVASLTALVALVAVKISGKLPLQLTWLSSNDIMISLISTWEETVAQFIVRNIENGVKARLQRRARRNGHSMEEEVRDILRDAVIADEPPAGGLGTEISRLFAKGGLESDIPELRGHEIKPPSFEE